MRNKFAIVIRIIPILVALSLLSYSFFKTTNVTAKVILTPFLICIFTMFIKDLMFIFNKNKFSKIYKNVFIISFLVFWFGFLIFFCYISIKNREYLYLLFSLPFWLAGVSIVNKYFFNKTFFKLKLKINIKMIVSAGLVIICLISGILMLFFGVKDSYELSNLVKSYISTDGYFNSYEIYSSDKEGITYKLNYCYNVNGEEYMVSTNYGTNYIPKQNSIREVKYNPENPSESILVGTNNSNSLIFIGIFFTLVSITFILITFSVLGYFDKVKFDIIGTYIGLVFFIIGIGIILFQSGTTGSLLETIKSFGLWFSIPIMFIIIGIVQFIKSLLFKRKE